jgi:hypothetical protein
MSLNVGDQEYNSGKKYRQKGALCGPNTQAVTLGGTVCQRSEPLHFLQSSPCCCFCLLRQLITDLISFYWQPEDGKVKPVPYPIFSTMSNTLDIVGYPGNCYF